MTALVLPHYWGVDVSTRQQFLQGCKTIRGPRGAILQEDQIANTADPPSRYCLRLHHPEPSRQCLEVLYTLFFCAVDGPQNLKFPHGTQECRPPTT